MTQCTSKAKCKNDSTKARGRVQIHATVNRQIYDKAYQDVLKRKEKNFSALLDYLLTCWHYSYDDDCDHCPYVDEEKEDAKKT